MNTPVSVCMASYNGLPLIQKQVESILKQLGELDELVVSDDFSKDGTYEWLSALHNKDSRIKLVRNTSTKRSCKSNFENALHHSSGDIIILSDQDDIWIDGRVTRSVNLLENYDFVVSNALISRDRTETQMQSYFDFRNSKTGLLNNLVYFRYLGCMFAFRRNVLTVALPFPASSRITHDAWLAFVAESFFSVKLDSVPSIIYNRHGQNLSDGGVKSFDKVFLKMAIRVDIVLALAKVFLKKFRFFNSV